jgi:ligand-binding sensor domain-containing protein
MCKRSLIFFLVFFAAVISFAQEEQYNFSRIDIENGLSHNQVNSILKDDIGFMWFGTMSGLNRYDGYKFKTFKHHQGDTTSINDDYIVRIVQGPFNKLWVLTRTGWNIYDPLTEKFNIHPERVLNSLNIPDDTFTDIVTDRRNNFWFVFPARGLYMYDRESKKTVAFHSSGKTSSLHSNAVSCIGTNSKGNIWIIYNDGIMEQMDGNSHNVVYRSDVLQKNLNTADFEFKLFIDRQDELWIYGFRSARGAFYYKPADNSIVLFDKDSKNFRLNSNLINGITQDDKGDIWIATDHGGVNLVRKKTSRSGSW